MKLRKGLVALAIISLSLFGYHFYQNGTFEVGLNPIHSQSAILIDTNGKTIASKRKNKKIKPASLTKIMTAIVALEKTDNINTVVAVDTEGINQLKSFDASMAGFKPNSEVTIRELLYGLMLPSGADAAVSLSKAISGNEELFVKEMNNKAKELGMTHTQFTNSYGLDDEDQYTTVADLALLTNYALKDGDFRAIFTSKYFQDERFVFYSTVFEKFGEPSLKNGELLGGKTGYTEKAGLCLVSLASIDGQEYVLVSVGAKGDHDTEQFNMTDARTIYNSLS